MTPELYNSVLDILCQGDISQDDLIAELVGVVIEDAQETIIKIAKNHKGSKAQFYETINKTFSELYGSQYGI